MAEQEVYVSNLAKALLKSRGVELEKTPEYLTEGAKLLKKTYGTHLAAYMCRLENVSRFNKWCKGEDLPQPYEAVGLISSIEITEILLGKLLPARAKEWMVTPCPYILDNLPMDFIREDYGLVKRAALQNFL